MKRGRWVIGIATGVVIAGLCVVSFINFYYRSEYVTGTMISQEVKRLGGIFQAIHQRCKILGFDNQQNLINFLNVEKFVGSEVGPMNLKYPEKWDGPYLKDNPTIQTKEFMVVHTQQGYFVTPGNGVRLPSGKVIGKDIVFDESADIGQMIQDRLLVFKKRALAQRLNLN